MTKHLMKRWAPSKEESWWTAGCFSRAWGNGPVQQLRLRYLAVPGLHFRLRLKLAPWSIAGATEVAGGSTARVEAAVAGSTMAGGGGGATAESMAGGVHGANGG